jgi:hypothetical protein
VTDHKNNNNRKNFACPFCLHRSSRKWNMHVHISRWHEDKDKEPLFLGGEAETLLQSGKDQRSPGPSKKKGSRFEPINEFYGWFVDFKEARRKLEEITSYRNVPYLPRVYLDENPGNIAPPSLHANTFPPFFSFAPPSIDSQGITREEIAGFMAKVCDNCTKIVIEVHYAVEESGKDPSIMTRNSHFCFRPAKPLTLQSRALRVLEFSAKLEELPLELVKSVRRWTGNDAYLVALKMPPKIVITNIIEIYTSSRAKANTNLRSSHNYHTQYRRLHQWALRAKENGGIGQVILNDDDLKDFMEIANNKTYGYFRFQFGDPEDNPGENPYKANIDKSSLKSEIFLMFINRGLLPV